MSILVYLFLLVVYLCASVLVSRVARSEGAFMINGNAIPLSALTGVVSSIGNICIILLVVFFNKKGFITSLVLLLIQFPIMLRSFIVMHNPAGIQGAFSNLLTILAIIVIYRRNKKIKEYQEHEVDTLKEQKNASGRLFEQTATALVNAVDAKDTYSHGHSLRVAGYSKRIAVALHKGPEECEQIYYAALLHDVGKIGIPNTIINKMGKLTEKEYEVIKQHPVKGNLILSSINEYPYLSIGAHFHHERYDGKGYPSGLKGEDIPEIARIISVADAYDAMTSNRSYRKALPQQLVREEFIKGSGTQFDPGIAKVMMDLIDLDTEYRMREKETVTELAGKNELSVSGYRTDFSDGIFLNQNRTTVHLTVTPGEGETEGRGASIVLFDALDGRVHADEKMIRELCYYEYAEIWLEGQTINKGVRKIETKITGDTGNRKKEKKASSGITYIVEAVRIADHVKIRIDDIDKSTEITIALPDSSRYAYISFTGENCVIGDVKIQKDDTPVKSDYITRIIDRISYIDGPEGDIPNVQVDGPRTDHSEGIPLKDTLEIRFHTQSLPTARLVWHCPSFVIYSSDDGRVNGENYREYALIRLDGENQDAQSVAENTITVEKKNDFESWDNWKEINKRGYVVTAAFERKGNVITTDTDNCGIMIRNTTVLPENAKNICVALTGDQCALTNIKIS